MGLGLLKPSYEDRLNRKFLSHKNHSNRIGRQGSYLLRAVNASLAFWTV